MIIICSIYSVVIVKQFEPKQLYNVAISFIFVPQSRETFNRMMRQIMRRRAL